MSLLLSGSYERASGQVVGPSEEAAGALMYGVNSWIRKKFLFDACDFEIVQKVGLQALEGNTG
ncbi:hypothetical protein DFAR_1460011 [Desulfarculales bacterium]